MVKGSFGRESTLAVRVPRGKPRLSEDSWLGIGRSHLPIAALVYRSYFSLGFTNPVCNGSISLANAISRFSEFIGPTT